MTEQEKRDWFLWIAKKHFNKPYIWGGDNPLKGFDCSGLIVECGKSIGILPRQGDWTAQMLYARWLANEIVYPQPGDLVFWGNSDKTKIVHVEIVISNELSLGASGGGSNNKDLQDAIEQDAYIKIRPFKSRPYIKAFLNPFV